MTKHQYVTSWGWDWNQLRNHLPNTRQESDRDNPALSKVQESANQKLKKKQAWKQDLKSDHYNIATAYTFSSTVPFFPAFT